MIDRYKDKRIEQIWSEHNRFSLWEKIELLYLNNILKQQSLIQEDLAPFGINVEAVKRYERVTKHELVAFLKELSGRLSIFDSFCPEAQKYLHYGLTSSDVIDTAFSLQIRDSILHLITLLVDLKSSLTAKIRNISNLDAIGRTHGKHAEPINFKNRLRLFNEELLFCLEKLTFASNSLYGKMQGPVGTSSFVNVKAAEKSLLELNLKTPPIATQVIPRLYYTDTMYSIVMLASVYERFATLIRLSAIDEIDEIQESFSIGQTGSSAMPHKNNPVTSENICGLARYLKSNFQVALDNNNLWWERDISHSSNERLIWPESFHLICNLTLKLKNLINNMQINYSNITRNLNNSNFNSHEELLNQSTTTTRFEAYEKIKSKYHS
jgi:adenylosuccinate lyase